MYGQGLLKGQWIGWPSVLDLSSQYPNLKSSHKATCICFPFTRSLGAWVVSFCGMWMCACVCVCVLSCSLSSVYGWGELCSLCTGANCFATVCIREWVCPLRALLHWPTLRSLPLFPSHTPIFHPRYLSGVGLSHWKWQSLKKKNWLNTGIHVQRKPLERSRSLFSPCVLGWDIAFPPADSLPP